MGLLSQTRKVEKQEGNETQSQEKKLQIQQSFNSSLEERLRAGLISLDSDMHLS